MEYRTGDILVPKLDRTEPLAVEWDHVVRVIHGEAEPISGGAFGVEVVRVLEAAQRSMRSGGVPVEVAR